MPAPRWVAHANKIGLNKLTPDFLSLRFAD
ncbi:hypothetical protein JOF57_003864 [Mycolicibacterium lutetiense]|uniref:Uncharacterized protein n=1 Tax=Mycolicibacterium lutetiense TaxID=1641992 RepID=A0ABS4ZWQ3_9MYCO|nr:hypothetical protein [Mycolicibacterium lutetiense]